MEDRILEWDRLTPENVRDAVARVRPDGVDVSSGVEERPGKKSLARMRQFVDEVNQACR